MHCLHISFTLNHLMSYCAKMYGTGATQAIALAYDMIQVGRAERMLVIAGDSASSDNLMPWLGNGFRVLGAATTCSNVAEASVPFNQKRSGMILGSGGIGIMLESEDGARRRHALSASQGGNLFNGTTPRRPFKCRLLGTLLSNSAYHGASMDCVHIAEEMERFVSSIEKELGITRKEIATQGVYFSHETMTHASASQSCAANEVSTVAFALFLILSNVLNNYIQYLKVHYLTNFLFSFCLVVRSPQSIWRRFAAHADSQHERLYWPPHGCVLRRRSCCRGVGNWAGATYR